MPNSQALQNAESQEGEAFSLRDILDIFLNHWKWFLLSAIVCLALSQLYLATKSRIYQRQAVILVKEDASTGGRKQPINTDALMQLNGVMGNTSVKNELYILRSYQLMQEVDRFCDSILDKSSLVLEFIKKGVDNSTEMDLQRAIQYDSAMWGIISTTEDKTEGMKAFLEKRVPSWKNK